MSIGGLVLRHREHVAPDTIEATPRRINAVDAYSSVARSFCGWLPREPVKPSGSDIVYTCLSVTAGSAEVQTRVMPSPAECPSAGVGEALLTRATSKRGSVGGGRSPHGAGLARDAARVGAARMDCGGTLGRASPGPPPERQDALPGTRDLPLSRRLRVAAGSSGPYRYPLTGGVDGQSIRDSAALACEAVRPNPLFEETDTTLPRIAQGVFEATDEATASRVGPALGRIGRIRPGEAAGSAGLCAKLQSTVPARAHPARTLPCSTWNIRSGAPKSFASGCKDVSTS